MAKDKTDEATITLGIADHRIGRLEHGVEDVGPILNAHDGGTEVPADKEEAVKEAAAVHGIKLRKL